MLPLIIGLVLADACPREGLSLLQLRVNQTSGYEPLVAFPEASGSWCRFGDEMPYWTIAGQFHEIAVPCTSPEQCSELKGAVEAYCKWGIGPADCSEETTNQIYRGVVFASDGLAAGTCTDSGLISDTASDAEDGMGGWACFDRKNAQHGECHTRSDYQGHSTTFHVNGNCQEGTQGGLRKR